MPNSPINKRSSHVRVQDFLVYAKQRLVEAGIDNPDLDARLLVCHGLKIDRVQLLTAQERVLSPDETTRLSVLIECRAGHSSVARIMGQREFWGLPFLLNHATLEPRPDSEILIETALKKLTIGHQPLRILDLGTGTGCLLLSLLHELPTASGLGIDAAFDAVTQAKINAVQLGLSIRAAFKVGSWIEKMEEKFDIIVSNPPYIPAREISTLMPEVRDHDPWLALDGGTDGLDAYRAFVPSLKAHLKAGGFVVLEFGEGQGAAVTSLLNKAGFENISLHKDLAGIERCALAT